MPGRAGIPHNLYGHLMCGDYLRSVPHAASAFVRAHGPLAVALAAVLLAARLGWALWRRRTWRNNTERAVWLQVIPPVTATPAATHDLWSLLVTLLPAPRRWDLYPLRLVWEVHATPSGMRAGLWVPPGVNPTAVKRALQTGWPGVRVEQVAAPGIAPGRPGFGVELRAAVPDWLPLVDDAAHHTTMWPPSSRPEDDRIRAVFDGLAAAGRTGAGMVQVHVIRAPGHRVAVLRRATVDPSRARRPHGALRLVMLVLLGVRALLGGVLDLFTHNPTTSGRTAAGMDPVVAEQARHARSRHASGPHLLVAVHAFATGPTVAAARAAAADITAGYSLLAAHWRPRRLWHPATRAAYRWTAEGGMHLATTAEVAALAGLPAHPATFGLPAAPSRRLAPTRDTFTAPAGPAARGATATARAWPPLGGSPGSGAAGAASGRPDEDPPTVWSTP